MNGFVYLWENTENKKMYIGSHLGNVNDGYVGSGVYFKRAFEKKPENFKRTIIYTGNKFRDIETFILKSVDAANSDRFYNLKNDAVGGWSHCQSKEIKEKRGKALSEAKIGIAPPCASRDKKGTKNPMYGKNHSDITKRKISDKRKGVANKKSPLIETTTGLRFERVMDAAKYYGLTSSTMSTLIRNELITRGKCKNKIFKYV